MNTKKIILILLTLVLYITPVSYTENIEYRGVKEQEETIVDILLLGDVCLATNYGRRTRFHTKYDKEGPGFVFEYMKPYFDKADYVVANLENVFTDNKEYQKGKIYTYKADKKYVDVIYESGITHVAVINNHMHDYLQQGFEESMELLEEGNIKWFGTNECKTSNIELGNVFVDKKEIIEKEGFKIGLVSYYGFNTSYASDSVIERDIEGLQKEEVDYIISYVHWGGQGTYPVTQRQKEYGRKLIDKGVDLVIGGHPHVVQSKEIYKDKHIYYSLGDFMFVGRNTPRDPDGLMVGLRLTKDKETGKIIEEFEHIPVLWGGAVKANEYTPRVGGKEDIERGMKKLFPGKGQINKSKESKKRDKEEKEENKVMGTKRVKRPTNIIILKE